MSGFANSGPAAKKFWAAMCHERTHAAQQNLSLDHLVNALMNSRRCIQAQRLKK
jgi:hypothetical protein